jgi:SAM-dependent methyltransferase
LATQDIGARVPDDWFVGFHRGLAARFWRAVGAAMLDKEWQVVGPLLDGYRSVLDLPCGDGRLTVRLAEAGHEAVGVDISAEEVEHARRRQGTAARFLVGDLRALPDEATGPFDAVLSWGNSFGYTVPSDSARSLAAMHGALGPGGRLVLESGSVAEAVLPGGVDETDEYEFGGVRASVRHRYVPAESRLESEYVFEDETGATETVRAAHHVHTTGELVRMLKAAGFGSVELLAPDGSKPYALGDGRVIAVATA